MTVSREVTAPALMMVGQMKTKESRKKSGKLMGLHTSNMVVMLTDVSDGVCEEVCNPAK